MEENLEELTDGAAAKDAAEAVEEVSDVEGVDCEEAGVTEEVAADGEAEGADEAAAGEEAEELIELEIDEDAIYAYIVDENDNEIGFIVLGENGEEEEYYYAEDAAAPARSSKKDEFDFGISREGVAAATSDMNAIYRDGAQVAAELKSTFDEISESLNFLKKKK